MAAVHAVTVPLLPPCPPAHGLQRVRSGEVAPSGPAASDPVWWLLHEATVLQVGSPAGRDGARGSPTKCPVWAGGVLLPSGAPRLLPF